METTQDCSKHRQSLSLCAVSTSETARFHRSAVGSAHVSAWETAHFSGNAVCVDSRVRVASAGVPSLLQVQAMHWNCLVHDSQRAKAGCMHVQEYIIQLWSLIEWTQLLYIIVDCEGLACVKQLTERRKTPEGTVGCRTDAGAIFYGHPPCTNQAEEPMAQRSLCLNWPVGDQGHRLF
jgi:hypothetical protein